MIDQHKIDSYFNQAQPGGTNKPETVEQRHTQLVRMAKLLLPGFAAILISMLLIFPSLQEHQYDFKIDITKPKAGEMEKLHMENTVFNITGQDNQVQHFTAQNIDETEPGSKLIKLTNPKGIIPTAKGPWYNIEAPIGYYDQNKQTLRLEQNVDVIYSDGMMGKTQAMTYDFKTETAVSTTPTHADGTFGSLDSQGFKFYNTKDLIIFTGKTHIVIDESQIKD